MNVTSKIQTSVSQLLRASNQSWHSRIVAIGAIAVSVFFPFWIYDIVSGTINGAASLLLIALAGFGFFQLWQRRSKLAQLEVSAEDVWLGHALIFAAILAVPFCFSTEWMQKVDFYIFLVGAATSSWGLGFFQKYPLPVFLIFAGFFPQPTAFAKIVWQTFTPQLALERFMAVAGALGLKAIGQSPTVNWDIIALPTGAVRVDWGCNGFDLATIAAVTSLLLGVFWKQPAWKVTLFVLMGIFFSLLANVPRIVLMTLASVYWGPESFEFWHGFWGGQIFLSILFTVHYYAMLALLDWKIGENRPQELS
ncbi:MAG: cyanoexosortase C [Limnothrix sp.]